MGTGKRAERTKRDFQCLISRHVARSVIGQVGLKIVGGNNVIDAGGSSTMLYGQGTASI